MWRTAFSKNVGGWKAYDQAHEEAYNHPMKSAISRNQQNEEILENIGHWLPKRASLVREFQKFVFPHTQWVDSEYERKESEQVIQMYNKKFEIAVEFFQEHFKMSLDDLLNPEYKDILHATNGKELVGNKELLLECHNSGFKQYGEFVEERLIRRDVAIDATIKKASIPVFPYCDASPKKTRKPTHKNEKKELQRQVQLISVLRDRPAFDTSEVNQYQVSTHHALMAPGESIPSPNIKSNKASALKDYIIKVSPDAISVSRPSNIDFTILEGENLIFGISGHKTSVREQILSLIKYKIKPYFVDCNRVLLLFDDPKEEMDFNLKKTDTKRYQKQFAKLELKGNTIVHDWDMVLKQQENKNQFKQIFVEILLETADTLMEENQELYVNGTETHGIVRQIRKTSQGLQNTVLPVNWNQNIGESDTKNFTLLNQFSEIGFKNFLIFSKDTDVKMLAIFWLCQLPHVEIFIQSGTILLPSYFNPKKYVEYMKATFKFSDGRQLSRFGRALLRTYILYGCDMCPGWVSLGHSVGMYTFDEISKTRLLKTHEDYLYLVLKSYETKNKGLNRLFLSSDDFSIPIASRLSQTREIIKSFKGSESETIPILSVLDLQVKRSEYICELWINKGCNLEPVDYGWKHSGDGNYDIMLQDENDPFFSLPQHLLLGCGCKQVCSKKCSCVRDTKRLNKCSRVTCKSCSCYKRVPDTDNENVLASEEYQQFLDEISSASEMDSDADSVESNFSFHFPEE